MEKEKKLKNGKKTSTVKQSPAAEIKQPKKTAARKKDAPVAINTATPKKATAAKKTTARQSPIGVSHDEIARLAHRYWIERGHTHGNHMDDWLRAERELFGKAS
ncbi:MAG TPA: DUF2934 domain-containing protein [Terracidiphilus sp.]|jgi:hypothetical protein|nr:DUF2934 domain-containing protein [Terracidiphilus sp.]